MVFAHKHKRTLLIFSGLLLVLLILGSSYYYRTGLSDKRPPDSSSGTAGESGDSSAEGGGTGEMVREVSKTEPGSVLVCRRFYIRCRHTVTEETAMAARYVGKTGEDLRLAYPAWDLVAFTPERAVFTVNIDGYCPNHYIIREEGGYLIIYRPEKESGDIFPEIVIQ